jgi:hypothetical protein
MIKVVFMRAVITDLTAVRQAFALGDKLIRSALPWVKGMA